MCLKREGCGDYQRHCHGAIKPDDCGVVDQRRSVNGDQCAVRTNPMQIVAVVGTVEIFNSLTRAGINVMVHVCFPSVWALLPMPIVA